jgi:YbbR domain-containing protein
MADMNMETVNNNIGLKALSLLLAVILWFSLTAGIDAEERVKVPVRLKNLSGQLTVQELTLPAVELVIAGPRIMIWQLDKDNLEINLDMKEVGPGTVAFSDLGRMVRLRKGLKVVRVYPSQIELRIVKK